MLTRHKLILAIDRPIGTRVSGEVLAGHLGVTRAMVWKHVRALQEIGLPLQSDGRSGYKVLGPIDASLYNWHPQASLDAWLKPHYFLDIRSTQTQAKAEAEAGLPEGHLWIAEHQRGGRGRLGRHWDSSYGGLWFSVLLRPPVPAPQAPSVTLVAAMAMAQAIEKTTQVKVALKWPNDIGVQQGKKWRKIAGILTEMSGEIDQTHWIVMGVGVNVNNHLPPSLSDIGTSLRTLTGKPITRGQVLNAFFEAFRPLYRQWMKQGFEPFRKEYWRLHRVAQRPVRLKTAQGIVAGTALGVDGSGALIVKSRREIHHLLEGEIIDPR